MKFNPIVKRDLTVGSRSTRLTVLITALNAVLLGVDILAIFGRFAAFRLEARMDYRSMLYVYCIAVGVVFLFVLFLYPAMTVGSITTERDSGTMDLMLASGLSSRRIVFGKFISGLLPGLVLLATFLPGLVLPLLFGGVEVTSCLQVLLLFVPMAMEMLCIGLYASARTRSGASAGVAAYVIVLGITLLPLAAAALLRGMNSAGENPAAFLIVLSPVTPAAGLLADQVGENALLETVTRWLRVPGVLTEGSTLIITGAAVQVLAALLFFFAASSKAAPDRRRKRGRRTGKQLQTEEK